MIRSMNLSNQRQYSNTSFFLTLIALVFAALLISGCTQAAQETTAEETNQNEAAVMTTKDPVVLINMFTVPEGKLDDAVTAWEAGRDFLSQQKGYISTKLHKSLSPDAQYHLINVAEWETAEDFKTATAAMRANSSFPPVEGVTVAPALYTVIRN